MTLDLNDPQSIAAWYRAWPSRHGQQLAFMARVWPQFKEQIAEAGRLLRASK